MDRFWKLNALGNNFVFTLHDAQANHAALARRVCAIATSIGADGLLTVDPTVAPPMVRMWNPDGTTDFCGNGLCCAAHLLRFLGHDRLDLLDTPIRRVPVAVETTDRSASRVTVRMERGTIEPDLIPLAVEHAVPAGSGYDINVAGQVIRVFCLNNGNMHSLVICDRLPSDEVFLQLGPRIENHPLFPYRTNVLWCVLRGNEVRMRIWERGVGETLSCGTGAAAVYSIFERLGLISGDTLSIVTTGGVAEVKTDDGELFLTVRVALTFEGSMIDPI